MATLFKTTKYVTEKTAGFRKGQFVQTQSGKLGVVEQVQFERIEDGWSFGLQSEYGYKCTAICHVASTEEQTAFAQQQAEKAAEEAHRAERRTAKEQINALAAQAKEQGTKIEREDIQGRTTRVQVRLDSYNNDYFLLGESAIWYIETQDVYATIWRLPDNVQVREQLQQIAEVLK